MKSTKKTLFLSIMSMLLCVAMLIGTTWAWFTDDVTSGTNKIVAGNLDIELEYSKDGTTWATVESATDLFSDVTLWEPGATSVVYLKLTNEGSLALKYNLAITATGGDFTNVAGEAKNLKDALKFAQVAGSDLVTYATREEAVAATSSVAIGVKDYAQANRMAANDVSYITLVVTMPDTVADGFNYKPGTTAPSIDLGITLTASQYASESDSFDKYYDLMTDPIEVYTAEEFTKALEKAADNAVINVMSPDLTLTVAFNDAKAITLKGAKITKLIANAPEGVIYVYNDVGVVEGTVVAMSSAHLFGKVQTLDATKGRFVVEEVAEVENIQTTEAAVAETLKIDVRGTVKTLTTEKGTVEIGSTARVEEIVATANTTDALVIKVAENAEVTKIATPAVETAKPVDLQISGKVATLDVPTVNDRVIVRVASTGVVDELKLDEEETNALQIKNEGTIKNEADVAGKTTEPFVAKIGEQKYVSLRDALAAAEDGETVELLQNVSTGTSYFEITKAITLDFGTSILTSTRTSYPVVALRINAPGKTVTFQGTTGGIQPNAGTGCVCVKNGDLVIESGEYVTANAAVVTDDTGTKTLTVKGGKLTAMISSGYGRLIAGFAGDVTVNGGELNIKNTDQANYVYMIEMEGSGYACTINGGDITADGGLKKAYTYVVCGGSDIDVNINGGNINASAMGSYVRLVYNTNATVVIKDIHYQSVASSYGCIADAKSLTIEGGTFDMTPAYLGYGFVITGQSGTEKITTIQGKISGGTFTFHPGAFYRGSKLEKNYDEAIAEGYKAIQNDDNTWSVVAAD